MSERMHANVVVVGAGPAGTAAAAHLGSQGVRNVVVVDRHDFPRDKTCGSGVSPKGIDTLKALGVWREVEPHAYWIKGIRIVTPGGYESWQSAGDTGAAIVCPRRILDEILLERAKRRGARFVPGFDATHALEDDRGRIVGVRAADGREIHARWTLVAGGAHCRIGQRAPRPRRTIQAVMGWWDDVPFRAHHLEMIFDRMVSPYYGWLFPEGDGRVNIGITYEDDPALPKKNARRLFQRFLDVHYRERLSRARPVGTWKGHPIVWSYAIEALTAPGRVVIGESGLLTHPATAEGIYQGMRSGMLAAEAVADVLTGRVEERSALAQYERGVRDAFQLSFWAGGVFRRLVRTQALDWLVRATDAQIVQSTTAKLMAQM